MTDLGEPIVHSENAHRDGGARKRKPRAAPKYDLEDLEAKGREIAPDRPIAAALKEPAPERINMARLDRLVSLLSGAALIAYGITRRDRTGWALALSGGGLALCGATGYCPVYGALNVNTALG